MQLSVYVVGIIAYFTPFIAGNVHNNIAGKIGYMVGNLESICLQ